MYGILNSEGKGIIEFVKMKYIIEKNFEGDFNSHMSTLFLLSISTSKTV
jgi:hypothetical protein